MKRPDITVPPANVRVKRIASIVLFAASVGVMAWIFWRNAIPLGSEDFFYPNDVARNGEDFRLRMNEIDCLKSGIDPFLVWSGEIVHPKYYPAERTYVEDERPGLEGARNEPINAYPPWEYAYMSPFSCVARNVAWYVYLCLKVCVVVFLLLFGFKEGCRVRRDWTVGLLFAALATLHWLPSWYDIRIGNFGLIIAAAIVGMVMALRSRHDVLAGILYAIAMSKPQLSILLSVPLLVHRKFSTLAVAVAVCLSGTFFSSFLAGVSPIAMILETPKANVFAFSGCALFPSSLVGALSKMGVSNVVMVNAALAAGLVLCAWLCWMMRYEKDWLWLVAPPVFMGAAWTYNQWHSYCPYAVVAVAMGFVLLSQVGWFVKTMALIVVGASMRADLVVGRGLEFCFSVLGRELPLVVKSVLRDGLQLVAVLAFVILIVRRCAKGAEWKRK